MAQWNCQLGHSLQPLTLWKLSTLNCHLPASLLMQWQWVGVAQPEGSVKPLIYWEKPEGTGSEAVGEHPVWPRPTVSRNWTAGARSLDRHQTHIVFLVLSRPTRGWAHVNGELFSFSDFLLYLTIQSALYIPHSPIYTHTYNSFFPNLSAFYLTLTLG